MHFKELIRNLSYTIISNLTSLLISTVAVLIVPRFIGVKSYGYWQLYMFYASYVGVLHFGWIDGINLRYAGKRYEHLDKSLFHSQIIQFALFQILVATVIAVFAGIFSTGNELVILELTAVSLLLSNFRQFFLNILQGTARMKEYATITMLNRVAYFASIVLLIISQAKYFEWYISADLIGQSISTMYAGYICRDILDVHNNNFFWSFNETWINLSTGIKLLIANFAGNLIVGIVRYGIQITWGVATFGKVSLTLNISNLAMTFVNAVSLVLYPMLRRTSEKQLSRMYRSVQQIFDVFMLIFMLLYYPVRLLLPLWLPQYSESLKYMSLLFPMCIYSGKFSLLISTFMKTYRMENRLLEINIISVINSIFLTFIGTRLLHSLTLSMVSIVLALWLQSTIGELFLSKKNGSLNTKLFLFESLLVALFMISNSLLTLIAAFAIYTVALASFILFYRKEILSSVHYLVHF